MSSGLTSSTSFRRTPSGATRSQANKRDTERHIAMATQAAASTTETNLGFILEQVAKEKGIDKKILVDTIEAAILKAAQSAFGPTRELEARFSDETGQVDLFQYMTVVEKVGEPEREISTADVSKHKLDATLGE